MYKMATKMRSVHWLHIIISLAYVVAFGSLHAQWEGLLGPHGLQPAHLYVKRLSQHFGSSGLELLLRSGSFALSGDIFRVSTEGLCQALLVVGLGLSILQVVLISFTPLRKGSILISLNFALMWFMYHSLVVIGQTFLSFQWDLLLGEVGFLAVSSSLLPEFTPNKLSFRFLAFKLMFMSGLSKIQAQCPTWINLTALEFHFASQPLPTPLAWFAHQLPPTLLRFSVLMTLVIEIPLTLLLVLPFKRVRRIGSGLQILLQLVIAATGNYTFFNGLTAALMLAVWADDAEWSRKKETHPQGRGSKEEWWRSLPSSDSVQITTTFAYTILSMVWLLDRDRFLHFFSPDDPSISREWWDGSMLGYYKPYAELQKLVSPVLGMIMVLYIVQIGYYTLIGLYRLSVTRVFCSLFSLVMLSLSLITFQSFADVRTGLRLPKPVFDMYDKVSPLRPVSAYGLFRRMTGVAPESPVSLPGSRYEPQLVSRPELVLEGYDDKSESWREIDFKYKPGDPTRRPPWVAPHQPRLDWQMWFAALGNYQSNPWLVHLVWQLLHKESEAWTLVDKLSANNREIWKLGRNPPSKIRVVRYDLDFTRASTPWSRASHTATKNRIKLLDDDNNLWWHRLQKGLYLDALDLNNLSVVEFLRGTGTTAKPGRSHLEKLHEECLAVGQKENASSTLNRAVCACILVRKAALHFTAS